MSIWIQLIRFAFGLWLWRSDRQNSLLKLSRDLLLLDLRLFFFCVQAWADSDGLAERAVWLAFISFTFSMKRAWCKWEEMLWFIHNAAWIFHLGSGQAACLDEVCCVAVKSRQSFYPSRLYTDDSFDWCTFPFIRPKCSARQWISRGRCLCCIGGSLLSVI